MKKIIRYIDQLTNRIIPNCSAQKPQRRARHQVSPYPNAALLSPSFPTRSGSPILEDSRPGGSSINLARGWVVLYINRRPSRCTSIA